MQKSFKSGIQIHNDDGGVLLSGGNNMPLLEGENGYFGAQLLEGLVSNCATNQEEIFGPVVTSDPT